MYFDYLQFRQGWKTYVLEKKFLVFFLFFGGIFKGLIFKGFIDKGRTSYRPYTILSVYRFL